MKYVSGWIVWGIYTWLGWSGEVAEPIGSSEPARAHYFLLHLEHGESLKTRKISYRNFFNCLCVHTFTVIHGIMQHTKMYHTECRQITLRF